MAESRQDDLLALGQMAIEMGQWEQARDYFNQALEIDPDSDQALAALKLIEGRLIEDTEVRAPSAEHALRPERWPSARRVWPPSTRVVFGISFFAILMFLAILTIQRSELNLASKSINGRGQISTAEKEYLLTLASISYEYSTSMEKVSRLMAESSSNPLLLLDDSWREDIALQLMIWMTNANRVRELSPPRRFASIHHDYLAAANSWDKAAILLAEGIGELNLDKIKRSNELLYSALEQFEQAKRKLEPLFLEVEGNVP